MLIELPNGDWIDPATVAGLKYLEPSTSDPTFGHRIVVITYRGTCTEIPFDTRDAAHEWRREFGLGIVVR